MQRPIKFRVWIPESRFTDAFMVYDPGYDVVEDTIKGKTRYELMQYTGLHDKNGKEIYEGDVVRLANRFVGIIIYTHKGYYCAKPNGVQYWVAEYSTMEIEIIGNKFENPELPEGK